MLEQRGISTEITCGTYDEYQRTLYKDSGLRDYGRTLARLKSESWSMEDEQSIRDTSKEQLWAKTSQLDFNELATIWFWEARCGNPNYCFAATAWPGSPVMEALGMDYEPPCTFLQVEKGRKTRLARATRHCMSQEQPHLALTRLIFKDTKHSKEVRDEDGQGIPMNECPTCCAELQRAVVGAVRDLKKQEYLQHMTRLTGALNAVTATNPEAEYEDRDPYLG